MKAKKSKNKKVQNKLILTDDHRYFLGDRELISVTQVIDEAGLGTDFNKDEEARIRGKDVHTATHFDDEGDLHEASVRADVIPFLEAWRKFRRESGFKPKLIEVMLYNEIYGFAGTLDRVGRMNKCECIVDIKSGTVPKTTDIQTGGYEILYGKNVKRFGVNLKKNGKYSLIPYDHPGDKEAFLGALAYVKYKRRKKI